MHLLVTALQFASLSYIDICIDVVNSVVRGLHDSGAQISVIHQRIVERRNLPRKRTINNI